LKTLAAVRGSGEVFQGTLLCSFKLKNKVKQPFIPKDLPARFSDVGLPEKADFDFLDRLKEKGYDIPIGELRVRGRYRPVVCLKGDDLARHVGVYAITGKGKTGFTKVLLHHIALNPEGKYSALVFDAHDEYYKTIQKDLVGLKETGMENVYYYDLHSKISPRISLTSISPEDFRMIWGKDMSVVQSEACSILYSKHKHNWLEQLIDAEPTEEHKLHEVLGIPKGIQDSTLLVLKRRARILEATSTFIRGAPLDFVQEVLEKLDKGNVVIVNTRNLGRMEEKAVLSVLSQKILNRRKNLLDKPTGAQTLQEKPVILIVLEEALSVLSQSVLQRGSNIFSEITREGRKYKLGLLTVVQIPHRLDQDVASNINTNVILGLSQDRSRRFVADNAMDDLAPLINEMKMLDVGEAIVSYPHKGEVPFPLPVRIFYYNDLVKEYKKDQKPTSKKVHKGLMR
ncbi:MAG: ATP-binding protein, partial [Candidatus Ranarchaeia archaeon]